MLLTCCLSYTAEAIANPKIISTKAISHPSRSQRTVTKIYTKGTRQKEHTVRVDNICLWQKLENKEGIAILKASIYSTFGVSSLWS